VGSEASGSGVTERFWKAYMGREAGEGGPQSLGPLTSCEACRICSYHTWLKGLNRKELWGHVHARL
jgi:hypothetical protein